jgi:sugar/nucleoside kinase (ribokinase family)
VFNPTGFWCPSCALSSIPFCVKATAEELRFLPPAFISVQKDRMLIITKGAGGCDVFVKGKQLSCKPKWRISAPDTLGAGDTFFAAFVTTYEQTNTVKKSVRYAMCEVEKFLQKK